MWRRCCVQPLAGSIVQPTVITGQYNALQNNSLQSITVQFNTTAQFNILQDITKQYTAQYIKQKHYTTLLVWFLAVAFWSWNKWDTALFFISISHISFPFFLSCFLPSVLSLLHSLSLSLTLTLTLTLSFSISLSLWGCLSLSLAPVTL